MRIIGFARQKRRGHRGGEIGEGTLTSGHRGEEEASCVGRGRTAIYVLHCIACIRR